MVVIRPVRAADIEGLMELAHLAGSGMTTLPRDAGILRERIEASLEGFGRNGHRPRGETYLFVAEDLATKKVVGTCGIISKVGGFEPFYAYRVETETRESKMLGVKKEIRTLHLVAEHNGPSEMGSLFLRPEFRKEGNGRLVSLARFLFMAEHPARFAATAIAEMRGVIDERGQSPFWEAIGRRFFDLEFTRADFLSMVNKEFIADLMPRHPIYVSLLPDEAQAVIGAVHPQTRPALELLKGEGFEFSGMVDIFEAGPVMVARTERIRTVRASVRGVVREIGGDVGGEVVHVMNTRIEMRACRGAVEVLRSGEVRMDAAAAEVLEVRVGDAVRFAPTHGKAEDGGVPWVI